MEKSVDLWHQAFRNYNFLCTRRILITWYGGRNCTKLVLKPLTGKKGLLQYCVLLLSCRLQYFSLHYDNPPFLRLVHYTSIQQHYHFWSIKMRSSVANLKYWPWTIPVQLLLTHYQIPLFIWKPYIKYLNIRLRQIF